MTVYTFDNTLDGLLTAVFDSFALHQQHVTLLAKGEQLPLFANKPYVVMTDSEKAERVWKGLEKHLSKDGLHMNEEGYRIIAETMLREWKMI